MRRTIAAGIFVGGLMWCGLAVAQNSADQHPNCSVSIRGTNIIWPSVRGWHVDERDGSLVPDGAETSGLLIRGYVSDSNVMATEAAEDRRRVVSGPGMFCPTPPLLRERRPDVKGAGGRIFSLVTFTYPASGWRGVAAYHAQDGKLLYISIAGNQTDVEKNYAVFTGILRRYNGEAP